MEYAYTLDFLSFNFGVFSCKYSKPARQNQYIWPWRAGVGLPACLCENLAVDAPAGAIRRAPAQWLGLRCPPLSYCLFGRAYGPSANALRALAQGLS
jgi:hypothetical protein